MGGTTARISVSRFTKNIELIRTFLDCDGEICPRICLPVKADAYGHGAIKIGIIAAKAGVDWLAVATVDEAEELKAAGITIPILLLSLPVREEISRIVEADVSSVVADRQLAIKFAIEAARSNLTARLHLAIDTGMGRIGCSPTEAGELAEMIKNEEHLELEGVCTHFASADTSSEFTAGQIEKFDGCLRDIRARDVDPGLVHAANSAGMVGFPAAWYDMVRPGIIAFGYPPTLDTPIPVSPVMEFVSTIVFLKHVDAGTPISYGSTYISPHQTTIATVSAGYGDGYNRLLSNVGQVTVRGKRYPVVGRVCMDQIMVDVGNAPIVELYDEVLLFGASRTGPDAIEIARLTQTIPYEVTCSVGKRVRREYR